MSRLRVLHVVGNLELGGGQKLTALVATGLDPSEFDVTVLNLGPSGPYGRYIADRGVTVVDLGLPMSPRLGESVRVLSGLIRLVRIIFDRPRWDIVHTHMFRTSVLCAVPARLAGSRVFGTVHRIYYRWQPLVERLLAPMHEAIVVDSAAVGRILRDRTRIPADRYVVIHDGIDVTEFDVAPSRVEARAGLGLQPETVVVAEIAALLPHKGQRHLLTAFARVALSFPEAELLIVGDGPDRQSLEILASDLGIATHVVFTGERSDLAAVLCASDIVALPSSFEGFGLILAEAMYMGIPTIAPAIGGSTEVVVDGETGYLVPFGDVETLADRLDRLVGSAELRTRLGDAGRARSRALFTQERMADRYRQLYRGALRTGLAAEVDDARTGP